MAFSSVQDKRVSNSKDFQRLTLLAKLSPKRIVDKPRDKIDINRNSLTTSEIKFPVDAAFLRSHLFLVAESLAHQIVVYDLTRDHPKVGALANGRVWPNSITATRGGGHFVVTDRKDKMIKVMDAERGEMVLGIDTPYEDFGETDIPFHPHGVAVNSKGEIIVTDTGKHVVHIYTSDGKLRKTFGSKGRDALHQLCLPFYCTVDGSDNIIVSDNMNYCVKIFDATGNYKAQIGKGTMWGGKHFECPYGVCMDPSNGIIVADHDTHRVILHKTSGKAANEILTRMNQCRFPMGITVGPCGTFVVTEASKAFDACSVKAYDMYQ